MSDLELSFRHAATNVGSDANARQSSGSIHTHQATFDCQAATTGGGVVTHYGTNNDDYSGWTEICSFTFAAASPGESGCKVLQHTWKYIKSVCSALSGTSPSINSTISGE